MSNNSSGNGNNSGNNSGNSNNNSGNSNNGSNQNVYMAPMNDYEALFKIDLNFDMNVSEMNDTVLSNYITRIIQGHPYYVSLDNVVDIIVDEDSNKVTLIISNREVGDHIVNTTNNNTNEINALYNNIAPNNVNNEKLNIINAKYKDKKYILESVNENGEPVMYEYEFKGFKNAKSLYHDESIDLNGNMTRHFLSNDLGKTYFYDEYMNSQINFTPDERMNYLDRRIASLEDRLQHDGKNDPNNARKIRDLAEKAVDQVPQGMEVGITTQTLSNSIINNDTNDSLLPTEMVNTTGLNTPSQPVGTTSVSGVNNNILNSTNSVYDNNVVVSTPIQSKNVNTNNSRTVPVSTTSSTGLTYRALNNNAINNININENNVSVPVNTAEMSNIDFENVTTQITNKLVNNVNLNGATTMASNNRATTMASNNRATTMASNANANANKVNNANANANKVNNNANANANNANANNANANANNANANANNANANAVNANNANANANNLSDVDVNNIDEEALDNELKNIITDIKNIEDSRESKNYKVTIGIILALLVIILIGVIVYFVKTKNNVLRNNKNNSIVNTIKNNLPKFNKKNVVNSVN